MDGLPCGNGGAEHHDTGEQSDTQGQSEGELKKAVLPGKKE